jgi:hypothetical protein
MEQIDLSQVLKDYEDGLEVIIGEIFFLILQKIKNW